jgi:hypothetical protein
MGFFMETCSCGWQLLVGDGRFTDKIDDGVVTSVSTGVVILLIPYSYTCNSFVNSGVTGRSQGRNDGQRYHHG